MDRRQFLERILAASPGMALGLTQAETIAHAL